jgi:hypothetical protein
VVGAELAYSEAGSFGRRNPPNQLNRPRVITNGFLSPSPPTTEATVFMAPPVAAASASPATTSSWWGCSGTVDVVPSAPVTTWGRGLAIHASVDC